MKYKIILVFTLYCLLNFMVFVPCSLAQNEENTKVEMADNMRAEGKIYVVVLVVTIVFTGLTIYAINTERRLTKLEKEMRSLKSEEDS